MNLFITRATLLLSCFLFLQAAPGGQASLMKISDGTLKSVPATSQLSKPGTTMLRVAGGVITATASPAVALSANGPAQQVRISTTLTHHDQTVKVN